MIPPGFRFRLRPWDHQLAAWLATISGEGFNVWLDLGTGKTKVALDALYKAQGQGCATGILGIAIGGDRGSSYYASKETLFRQLDDQNENPELAALETRLTDEANQLGIGPMGFGGKTTVLGTKITSLNRLPASFYVSVSYMCWAYRRRRMSWKDGQVSYQ